MKCFSTIEEAFTGTRIPNNMMNRVLWKLYAVKSQCKRISINAKWSVRVAKHCIYIQYKVMYWAFKQGRK